MSAHARLPITADSAAQWCAAMGQAIIDSPVEAVLGARMAERLRAMAMVNRG